ncbi:hypothetical protein L2Y94_05390 [Luteibacter aegosomatis]|uniref:hypothetical protein n=1 Tax=Luteibacter aegosomatis TaxID=2911537 RepID=UPI001FFB348D|nr:hypothetical protein [Luteibacter aegosomatis]UPG86788.1 hypothetical protein L2Y94_05390 [Luteibacter aegosomatis]
MIPDNEPSLHDALRTDEIHDDPAFVMRTHRVVAVETLAHLERLHAWRACARDLIIAAAMVGGMILTSLWLLDGADDTDLVVPLVASVALWAWLHDESMPRVTMHADDGAEKTTSETTHPPA